MAVDEKAVSAGLRAEDRPARRSGQPPAILRAPARAASKSRAPSLSVILIVLAILIGDAIIAVAIIISADRVNSSDASQSVANVVAGPQCDAWITARRDLEAIPPLPTGWNWNTPDIDAMIKAQQNAIQPVLDGFETAINEHPDTTITPLARNYIKVQRTNMERQVNRTASAVDGDLVRSAYNWLNAACGLTG